MSSGINNQNFAAQVEQTNQGIVDGRQEGQQPPPAPVTLDTYVDSDASLQSRHPTRMNAGQNPTMDPPPLPGATSGEVEAGVGDRFKPTSGMTSKELHNNGMSGKKRDSQGISQWGPPGQQNVELDRAGRVTGQDQERFQQF
ncbi:hypothetical protein K435DRAFT_643785 [Dendrothele bispora CBS 962.96]|uniref:Uncharacterized protein n=1 Tax=Dendrothele bispora (strain CBS 962.96) TaxID=1314807 RepID=A0A4S8MVQ7_DENBC|nr:hypothetical protein K435DRAFT_643785 [Dendrothele bispora CBS 962.96]